jgi:hypothetical protein
VIVPQRKRRLEGIDQIVLSFSAWGLTTGEIAAHFEEVYGATVSKDTISRITEKVAGELGIWAGDGAEGARFWLQVFSSAEEPGGGGRAHRKSAMGSRACRRRSRPPGSGRWCSSASCT